MEDKPTFDKDGNVLTVPNTFTPRPPQHPLEADVKDLKTRLAYLEVRAADAGGFEGMTPKPKDPHAVALGRKGGLAGRGAAKARTSEQARKAVQAREEKRRQRKEQQQ